MAGPKFFQTIMGRKFFEADVPRLIRTLERIAKSLEASAPPESVPEKSAEPPMEPPAPYGEVFAVLKNGDIFCESCARKCGVDLEAEDVPTWEVGSDGWIAPCVCRHCRLSIPVVVNGAD